ncbi:MAG TPA: type 2 isopentenyl-diphosphate Delta-isomerase [Candidatus Baltobacteraceae bacterium]|jgi:isopentenyl-diphosphate delta-isomerase
MPDPTGSRKADHLRINVEEDVGAKGVSAGFDAYAFEHQALPEIDLDEVDTSCELLGKKLNAPLLVSCMTGGTPEAQRINATLAQVAEAFGLAMGLGSGRALIENPGTLPTFDVRPFAPNVLLLANLGAVQLNKGYGVDHCRRLMELLQADALVLHLNALQEALQPEGDTNFRGLLAQIATLCKTLGAPVVVKEVGWGIGPTTVRALLDAGVAGIDLAGAGGTSWSEVERYRIDETWRARVAGAFAGWGIPTTECIVNARSVAPSETIIASGGIRNGIDVAKAIALGADAAGIAGPFLRAAEAAIDEARDYARELIETLRIAMFCTGARTVAELRTATRLTGVQ